MCFRGLQQVASASNLSTSKTVQVIVEALNDGPTIAGPLHIAAEEDMPITVVGVTVHDPDCNDALRGVLEVAVTCFNGTVQFQGSVAGLYLMESLPGKLNVRGKPDAINAALAGLRYTGNTEFSGEDELAVTVDDLGNTGTGGRLRANMSIPVTVAAVNDPPQLSTPQELDRPAGGVLFVVEDEPTPLGKFGVSDSDDVFIRVVVSAKVGTLSIDSVDEASLLVTVQHNTSQRGLGSSIACEGAAQEVSLALARLTYTSSLNWNSVAYERDFVEVSCKNENVSGREKFYGIGGRLDC